jgi:DnaJ-class molecular chaperone
MSLYIAAYLAMQEQRRRLEVRHARPCRSCAGRGTRRRVVFWRGRRVCRVCWGRGLLGGR